jgi:hypothetical protein
VLQLLNKIIKVLVLCLSLDTEGILRCFSGGMMSSVLSKLTKGDSFVISVDCDEVLGSINPREVVSESASKGRIRIL